MNRDERIQLMLDRMRAAWQPQGDGVNAERGAFEAVARLFPEPEGVDLQEGSAGGVPAIDMRPVGIDGRDCPVVLYMHGGAFLIGSAAIYREQSSRLALAAGARVVTLDYRRAPEHPYPAALDDTVNAYLGLLDDGVDPGRVVLAGDSAGGNLALAAAMRLRDTRQPLPAGLVLISPWVDLTCSGDTMQTNADSRHLAQRRGLLSSAATYLDGTSPRDPLASPLFGDLSNLPPALIQVGELETLLDDSRELERCLSNAGASPRLTVYEGMVHEWHLLSVLLHDQSLDEARQAIEEIATFVREVTTP